MALSSEETSQGQDDWVDLEAIFVSRTIHIQSLSPLHLPVSSLVQKNKSLTQENLNSFARGLESHLNARLSQPLLSTLGVAGSSKETSFIQQVRATFLQGSRLSTNGIPTSFVVEIEVKQPNPSQSNPSRTRLETAQLLFYSTASRQTQTHYPVLLWKPLLSARAAIPDQPHIGGEYEAEAAQAAIAARLLTSEALHFVTAYFDCRISPLAPLHSIRGENLEQIAEGVAAYSRKEHNHLALEFTFALPSKVNPFNDDDFVDGPAPELNTISLSVPGQITEELLRETPSDMQILPAIRHYLSEHTSFQLSRLMLTRVGVASVYLGAPTSIMTPAGKASTGEVRLKISRDSNNESQKQLIENVICQVVQVAGDDEW